MPGGPDASKRHVHQHKQGSSNSASASASTSKSSTANASAGSACDPPGAGGVPPSQTQRSRQQQQQQQSPDMEPLACVSCRARKLKCDRTKPACTRCTKVNNECVYPESRRKPAFKRRNVKELEARLGKSHLSQVEDYLKEVVKNPDGTDPLAALEEAGFAPAGEFDNTPEETSQQTEEYDPGVGQSQGRSQSQSQSQSQSYVDVGVEDWGFTEGIDLDVDGDASVEEPPFQGAQLMGLGMSEPLPPFEVMEELNSIFFSTQYYYIPVVHQSRYLQAFYGSPLRKPPMCLQYAIWALASYINEKYVDYADVFYHRARQYLEADEMKGTGEHFITIGHAQAYAIVASYEAKAMLFTRAAMSSAKCSRLVLMMGLDQLDGEKDVLPPMLGPVGSWVELEERRRVFWGAYAIDSHASISTGWPSMITSEITTRLPASEQAFANGEEEQTSFLDDVFTGAPYAGFAGTIVICRIFKSIMYHVHRFKPNDLPEDINHGPFWKRHRELDNDLSGAFMFLPEKLRLPQNLREPTAIHTNLNLHASVICLHHAAIDMADKHNLPESIKRNSQTRLKTATEEIVNIIKLSAHNPGIFKSPLSALSMYCASTVYVYFAKEKPEEGLSPTDTCNLELIVHAMEAIGRAHNITREFLRQACADIERNGLLEVVKLPMLFKYSDRLNPTCSIPMLARGHIGRHSEVAPVLPGRLPLNNPKGKALPRNMMLPRVHPASLDGSTASDPAARGQEILRGFFQPKNISNMSSSGGGGGSGSSKKRRRTSPGPSASARVGGLSMMGMPAPQVTIDANPETDADMRPIGRVLLPDRTSSSSSSSPMYRPGGTGGGTGTGTETPSRSSHTSPEVLGPASLNMGLGNSLEENRVDLRAFQERVAVPLWSQSGASVSTGFFGQISDVMTATGVFPGGLDPWGILNEDIDWDAGTQMDPGPPGGGGQGM